MAAVHCRCDIKAAACNKIEIFRRPLHDTDKWVTDYINLAYVPTGSVLNADRIVYQPNEEEELSQRNFC